MNTEIWKQIEETQEQLREARRDLHKHRTQGVDLEWVEGEVAELEKNLNWLGRQLRLNKFNPDLSNIKLLICDIDNTLADRDSDTLYPHQVKDGVSL